MIDSRPKYVRRNDGPVHEEIDEHGLPHQREIIHCCPAEITEEDANRLVSRIRIDCETVDSVAETDRQDEAERRFCSPLVCCS